LPFGYSYLGTGLAVMPEPVALEAVPPANGLRRSTHERVWLRTDRLPPLFRV